MKKKILMQGIIFVLLLCMMGCTTDETAHQSEQTTNQVTEIYQSESVQINNSNSSTEEISNDNQEEIEDYIEAETEFSYEDIPLYSGKAYTEINNNIPSFSESDKQITQSFEFYSDLDTLGRCGQAYANICPEIQNMIPVLKESKAKTKNPHSPAFQITVLWGNYFVLFYIIAVLHPSWRS